MKVREAIRARFYFLLVFLVYLATDTSSLKAARDYIRLDGKLIAIENGHLARQFSTSTDQINWGSSQAFNLLGDMSAGVWVYLPSNAKGVIMLRGHNSVDEAGNTAFALIVSVFSGGTGSWNIHYFHDNGANNGMVHDFVTALPNNTWRYIGISRDATVKTLSLYVGDGTTLSLIESWAYSLNPTGGTDSQCALTVGNQIGGQGSQGDGSFIGAIEEHYLWGRKLSAAEHTSAMQGNPSTTNLLLECLMGNSPEQDVSGNGNAGTVTGTALVSGH